MAAFLKRADKWQARVRRKENNPNLSTKKRKLDSVSPGQLESARFDSVGVIETGDLLIF